MAILLPFEKIVTIVVAMFFFLSGWGMVRSVDKKEHYVREILAVKIPFLLWMAIFVYVFSAILEKVLLEKSMEGPFLPFGILSFIRSTNWYVWELIFFYLLFSICVCFIKREHWLLVVGTVSVVGFVALFWTDVVAAYYNSISGFVFGMYLGNRNIDIIDKNSVKILICAIAVLVCSFCCMFVLNHESIVFALIRNIAAVGGILFVLWMLQYWNPIDSVSRWMSKISPELYFWHMPITLILSKLDMSVMEYVGSVILISVVAAILSNIIYKRVLIWLKNVFANKRDKNV